MENTSNGKSCRKIESLIGISELSIRTKKTQQVIIYSFTGFFDVFFQQTTKTGIATTKGIGLTKTQFLQFQLIFFISSVYVVNVPC